MHAAPGRWKGHCSLTSLSTFERSFGYRTVQQSRRVLQPGPIAAPRRCSTVHATAGPEESGGDSRPCPDEATILLNALQQQQLIGSEYGEGFIQYRVSGEALHLDVDTLNERLQLKGAQRMRTAMRPDEAYGMIFSWDGVIADMRQVCVMTVVRLLSLPLEGETQDCRHGQETRQPGFITFREVQRTAWKVLADQEGLPFPTLERQIFSIRSERAIMEVLQWTRDWGTARRLSFDLALAVSREFETLSQPLPGVRAWLLALKSVKVPCALVTCLDRGALNAALERMDLKGCFSTFVTAEDGMETTSQRFLSAAIKLGRPPKDCVVFESSPLGITAAHNCSCKAVAVQGTHPAYQLKQADLTCSSLADLSVYNIRRLFSNRGLDFMDKKKAYTSTRGALPSTFFLRTTSGVAEP